MREHRKGWKITSFPPCIKNAFIGVWTQTNGWTKGPWCPGLDHNEEQLLAALATKRTAKSGRKCFDDWENESEGSYHEECYSRCDGDSQYRCQTRHDESRDWSHRDWDRCHYEEREHDTYSRDTNNRGRSSLTTSRSEEHLAAQVTFNYCDVRIKHQQAATRSDYSDLLGHSSGNGYCLEILATDMAPTLHLKCKFSTAHHLTEILQLVLAKIEQVAQTHGNFRLLLLLQDISDWSKAKTVVTRGHLDVTEIIDFHLLWWQRFWEETSIRSKIWSMMIPQPRLKRLLYQWLLPMWQEGQIQILFLHTSRSRGWRLGCRPWPTWILSREGTSVIPSR